MHKRSTALTAVAAAACYLDTASAFAPAALPASARPTVASGPLALRAQVDNSRRGALARIAVLAGCSPMALVLQPVYAESEMKKSKAQRDAEYEEDLDGMRKARYGRQPTRLDVERCVPKIAPIKDVMDAVRDGLENDDLAAVDAAIGDQKIESTKANVNLGLQISTLQLAKTYFYQYALKFSKGQDRLSPLSKDMKAELDVFYPAMAAVGEKAKGGDAAGAAAEFAKAEEAIKNIVDVLEAETRDGRINSVKVSLGVLLGNGDAKGLKVFEENMKEMRRRAKEGGPGGEAGKKFL